MSTMVSTGFFFTYFSKFDELIFYCFNLIIYRFSICESIIITINSQIKSIKNYRNTINLTFIRNSVLLIV